MKKSKFYKDFHFACDANSLTEEEMRYNFLKLRYKTRTMNGRKPRCIFNSLGIITLIYTWLLLFMVSAQCRDVNSIYGLNRDKKILNDGVYRPPFTEKDDRKALFIPFEYFEADTSNELYKWRSRLINVSLFKIHSPQRMECGVQRSYFQIDCRRQDRCTFQNLNAVSS